MEASFTASGVRRYGDDYQDAIALELLVEFLEHPSRYEWVRVEADDKGVLDDVVALRSDRSFVLKQVKHAAHPELASDVWTWAKLLETRKGKKGDELPSLLKKWSESLVLVAQQGAVHEASVVSNRRPAEELRLTLSPTGLCDFDRIADEGVRDTIIHQLGSEGAARSFFAGFHFQLDQPELDGLETSLQRRFYRLGGTHEGWLSLKDELRFWVRNRSQPSPDGAITLAAIRRAALWYQLQSLPQRFQIPQDYVLPSGSFHESIFGTVTSGQAGCHVVTGSPGVGKSTYLSYLYERLREQAYPVVRHHYFLSLSERSVGRFDWRTAAGSLMSDIQAEFSDSLGDLATMNPKPDDLHAWVDACGQHFAAQGKALVVIVDGLDHVWRERESSAEVAALLEHLLPAPDGVVVLVGTQPLSDAQLPSLLRREAPPSEWHDIPLLNRGAVEEWIGHHADEVGLPEEEYARNHALTELVAAFSALSQGHPLHLRYTLKMLQELDLSVTPSAIASLPSCPHHDITAYYEQLWHRLDEPCRQVLHLFAACQFAWPRNGIIECLDPSGYRIAETNIAVRQTGHLLVQSPLGLRPFHNSLLVFVKNLPDHEVYSGESKRKALVWLQSRAPSYWRWAHEWLLQADLGDSHPLIAGPSREWAVNALIMRYSKAEGVALLERSAWSALEQEDLPRCIEVGLHRTYLEAAYDYRQDALDPLLYPQLVLGDDPHLRSRLHSDLTGLRASELTLLAEHEQLAGNETIVRACFDALNDRLGEGNRSLNMDYEPNFKDLVEPVIRVAALDREIPPGKVVEFAVQDWLRDRTDVVLSWFSESLYAAKLMARLRETLREALALPDRLSVTRRAVLLALEEQADLSAEVLAPELASDPFVSLYAAIRKIPGFTPVEVEFPPEHLLQIREHSHSGSHRESESLFYNAFFCLLSNHLLGAGERNSRWLDRMGDYTWPRAFLHKLNSVASELALLLLGGHPPSYGWIFERFRDYARPSWPADREVYGYGAGAEQAVVQIALDLTSIASALGERSAISSADLDRALSSGYCSVRKWLDAYLARRRGILTEDAVRWMVDRQENDLSAAVEQLSVLAADYASLASLCALHGLGDEARRLVRESASRLITHGDHKDTLLFGVLDVVEACSTSAGPDARKWLAQISPAIARVGDFTDGDETSHLPEQMAQTLATVAPDLLPVYCEWLAESAEFRDALAALHAFLRAADLTLPLNQAVAKTAVDEESVWILLDRAREGDAGATTVLAATAGVLGGRIWDWRRPKETQAEDSHLGRSAAVPPSPAEFPPERFVEFLTAAGPSYYPEYQESIGHWIEHWRGVGQLEAVFQAVDEAVRRRIVWDLDDVLYDLALAVYGKDRAYEWLVRAHRRRHGWSRYFTRKEFAVKRWEAVRSLYPERWFQFIGDTLRSDSEQPWRGLSTHEEFVRLVEYCLFLGQTDLAKAMTARVVDVALALVSPLRLEVPRWTRGS